MKFLTAKYINMVSQTFFTTVQMSVVRVTSGRQIKKSDKPKNKWKHSPQHTGIDSTRFPGVAHHRFNIFNPERELALPECTG